MRVQLFAMLACRESTDVLNQGKVEKFLVGWHTA